VSAPPAAILVVSDRVSRGESDDRSAPELARLLAERGFAVGETARVPDEPDQVAQEVVRLCAAARLVLTTGGTGLGPRDRTPEATRSIADYEVPGLSEEMRRAGLRTTPMAMLSRGIAAVRGTSLVLNLPGSPSGALESLEAVIDALPHALQLLEGDTAH
jgi:molybdenum cofactor synthesis domain-containing protein